MSFPSRPLSSLDRLPPHSMEAEQGIIGCCLVAPDVIDEAIEARCQTSWFYDLRHQELWSVLTAMRADGTQIDLITFGQKLKDRGQLEAVGGLGYLSELMDSVPSAANLPHYLSIAADKSCRRRLLQAATRVMEVARDEELPSEAAAAEAESEILRVRSEYDAESDPTMKELMREAIDELQDRIDNGDGVRIPTYFSPIDRVTKGGHKPGNMVVIAARPSTGKTSLAMTLIRSMAAGGIPVGFFSLEMNKAEIIQAMAAQESGVRWGEFSKDNKPNPAEFKAMANAAGRLAKLPIQIVDGMWKGKSYRMNLAAIAAKTRRWVKKHGTKAIFIDYLQLIPVSGRGDNRQEKVAEISNGLKALAQELGIVVIVLAQLNREYEKDGKRKPRLSDLRESGCLSVSSTMLFTGGGVQRNTPSLMNTYSLSSGAGVVVRKSKNIPRPVKPVVRVALKSGRFIDCTPDHRILTDRGWVEAGSLTSDHVVASVRKIEAPSGCSYIPESKWIGWMLGNGSMVGYSSPSFICSDADVAGEFIVKTKDLFGLTPKPHRHKCEKVFQFDITAGHVRTPDGNPCKDWLKAHEMWGLKAPEKAIPAWFLEKADNSSIAELLCGLIETDGCVTGNRIKYSTTSNQLAWQVVWCFARLGIFAYLDGGFLSPKANHPCFGVSVSNGPDVALAQSLLKLTGVKGRKLMAISPSKTGTNFGDRLGVWVSDEIAREARSTSRSWKSIGYRPQGKRISQSDLASVLERMPSMSKLSHLVNRSIFWDRLSSVSRIDDVEVFDREVTNGPHNFVANGIVVHNCIEQDADFVGMLYSPDAEDMWDPDPMEPVRINMYVAKQRTGVRFVDIPLNFRRAIVRFEPANPA